MFTSFLVFMTTGKRLETEQDNKFITVLIWKAMAMLASKGGVEQRVVVKSLKCKFIFSSILVVFL